MIVDVQDPTRKGNIRERRSRRFRRARREALRQNASPPPRPAKGDPNVDMDLDQLFDFTLEWVVETLKRRNHFSNLMIIIAAQAGLKKLEGIPGMRLQMIGEGQLIEGMPDQLGHLMVPWEDQSPKATMGRLLMLAHDEPRKLAGLELMIKLAEEMEESKGHPDPYGFIVNQFTTMTGMSPTDIVMAYVREITRLVGASAVVVTSEAWYGQKPPGYTGQLKDLPTSKEALLVMLVTRAGVQKTKHVRFTREEKPGQERGTGRVMLVERPVDMTVVGGRITQVFHPDDQAQGRA
jgi:hypothetical protein